ncbi:hypothetical protein IAT38_000102 [Cryptococcus sp. DSM 104549]
MTLHQRVASPLPRPLTSSPVDSHHGAGASHSQVFASGSSPFLHHVTIPASSPAPNPTSPITPTTPNTPFKRTPVPYAKLLPLLVQRWGEGLTYAIIFPYINEMVHSMGVEESKVGLWSATAESALMVTEALSAPLYAPLADKFGRRPVMITLQLLWGVFGVGFGFARTVWGVIILRACLGLLAGCGVISRTMCGELCDKSNRVQGFAVFSPALLVGMTTAPLIGGYLARPVPRILSEKWTLFVAYPYLLPALATALAISIGFILCVLLLPETLDRSKHTRGPRNRGEGKEGSGGIAELLRYKQFQTVLSLYGLHNAVMFAFEAVFPLFGFTSKELGGLGLSTQTLGIIIGLSAGSSILMTAFVFPILHGSMSENRCLLLCLSCYPLATLLFPVMWAMSYAQGGDTVPKAVWVVMTVHMILRRTGDFAQTQLDVLIMDAIPGPEHLASANSLTFSIAAFCRAIGPFLVSAFFSLSTTFSSPFNPGRQLVWAMLVLLAVPALVLAWKMEDDIGGKEREGHEEERFELMGRAEEDE